jgi:hypothetical protein
MTVAEFVWPVSFAVMVTEFVGAEAGATNVAGAPLAVWAVIVPQLTPPHVSAQSKPVLFGAFVAVAVTFKLCVVSKNCAPPCVEIAI